MSFHWLLWSKLCPETVGVCSMNTAYPVALFTSIMLGHDLTVG